MSVLAYKFLHVVGLVLLMMGVGGAALHGMNGGTKATNASRKMTSIFLMAGLLVMLIAGFGALAKLGFGGMPGWVIAKLVIWLAIGAAIAPLNKKPEHAKIMWFTLPLLASVAAALGIFKPF